MAKETLSTLLNSVPGIKKCYFEPPTNMQLKYPCIIYKLRGNEADFADNIRYMKRKIYTVTIITEDPDSEIPDILEEMFPYCSMDSPPFVVDGLHHYTYTLYFSGPRISKEVTNNGIQD